MTKFAGMDLSSPTWRRAIWGVFHDISHHAFCELGQDIWYVMGTYFVCLDMRTKSHIQILYCIQHGCAMALDDGYI